MTQVGFGDNAGRLMHMVMMQVGRRAGTGYACRYVGRYVDV